MRRFPWCVNHLLSVISLAARRLTDLRNLFISEEFGIYLNYVRKLGFEETPDYEFLRELFLKVIKNMGDVEDDVYDWNLLNGGRGWESQVRLSDFFIVV